MRAMIPLPPSMKGFKVTELVDGFLLPDNLIRDASQNKRRRASVSVPSGSIEEVHQLIHARMRDLNFSRWNYSLATYDPWRNGTAINFDPVKLHALITLKVSKRVVRRVAQLEQELVAHN